jgi:hypothetical protein
MQSRTKLIGSLVLVLALALGLVLAQPIFGQNAQQASSEYYAETGHSIAAPFLAFFQAHGGVQIFGYPITEKLVIDQVVVQYFQRARMEVNAQGEITLTNLAEEMGYSRQPLASNEIEPDTPYRLYFPATGHSTSYAFLAYFQQHGGERIFGLPITEPIMENGRLVQYFQRQRMEWWPERAPNERVQLTLLGTTYAEQRINAQQMAPMRDNREQPNGATPTPPVTRLIASVSIKEPIARQSGTQTIYVLVTDQSGLPLAGANVEVVVHSSLKDHPYSGFVTSDRGIAAVTFPIQPDSPGKTIAVDVTVTHPAYAGLSTTARTSYFMWWGP